MHEALTGKFGLGGGREIRLRSASKLDFCFVGFGRRFLLFWAIANSQTPEASAIWLDQLAPCKPVAIAKL